MPSSVASPAHAQLRQRLARELPRERLIDDPLRRLAWGTDAGFYRLVPQLVVAVESEAELVSLLGHCRELGTPLTFRAAGTSLSGQAISDSVLVMLGDRWRGCRIADGGWTVSLQPGVIGGQANRRLAPLRRRIGPDPASIDAAMIGGIAANNASGMCCGTAHNSYHTLVAMRVVLADGSVLDSADPASRAAFAARRPDLVGGLATLVREVQSDAALVARIRHKFRIKNTVGYSLNALVDFDDPIDVLTHLMIGSEGTLGFISEITLRTVPEHTHKASALVLFADVASACRAVAAIRPLAVHAAELADRASLRAVEGQPGLPAGLAAVGPDGAALLVETRAEDGEALARQIAALEAALAPLPTLAPARFSTDAAECARYWAVRKGLLPSVAALRPPGTTVITEDVAFPLERLAEATLDLQALLRGHGYADAIVFGHALAGNLHFVFAQRFDAPDEVARFGRLMDDLAALVIDRHGGSLKAEHGTGRAIAPYVEREWGPQATALMRRIKQLFDPDGLLNPGVLLSDDSQAHLRHLKPIPAAHPLVDRCMECGFCEPKCPSAGLTLSPRQRIVGWRDIASAGSAGLTASGASAAALRAQFDHAGLDTCAGCGLCATACPVGIETGQLVKQLRGAALGPLAHRVGDLAARHFGAVTTGVALGLGAADRLHGMVGTGVMQGALGGLRRAAGGRVPHWSPALARPRRFVAAAHAGGSAAGERIVYFPSCAARTMGPQRGDDATDEALPAIATRLFEKAGFEVVLPPARALAGLCCGQPFESKGLAAAADAKAAELEAALRDASQGGRWPIVFDTSPCAWRMKRHLQGRLVVHDAVEFVHDAVLPRVTLTPSPEPVAVHPVCSVRKMGTVDKLLAVVARCSARPVTVEAVQCCGFAGDRGFTNPELNAHALRHLRDALPAGCTSGVSSSRTCEIGLAEHGGVPYRSFLQLVERCAAPHGPGAPGAGAPAPSREVPA